MFIQVIQGKLADADLLQRQLERWRAELKPGATGYLGTTSGATPDGRSIAPARLESGAAAQATGERADRAAWFNETVKAFDGEPTFHNCPEVATMFGGGSNEPGFVQVIQGRPRSTHRRTWC